MFLQKFEELLWIKGETMQKTRDKGVLYGMGMEVEVFR